MNAKTYPQVKKIWALARELGLDEDLLRAVTFYLTGSESISALTKTQAAVLIDELESKKRGETRPGMATPRQIWKIRELEKELGWADQPARLRGYLKKYAHVDDLRWLTGKQAWKVIEGLKKILARQERQRKGEEG
ncbi:MAG: regulatory protein GemA [Thermoanaerobacter sp.]|jgi:hypothetical protein|nr:regulatory protein GemA [Thermoanaerobacter sp.]